MLLTITTTEPPATDLGYLLHKHPERVQEFAVTGGSAHVFYLEADERRCTAAMLLDLDPVELARARRPAAGGFPIGQYVNDRPYTASSMLAVALKSVFGTAMTGRCPSRQELADSGLPLEIRVPTVSCGGDTALVHRLFEPLGWTVTAAPVPLDPEMPGWGDSPYADVLLTGRLRLADALGQLYVLLPALDGAKHYWVDEAEVDKLVHTGSAWLATHPEAELISRRYLKHRRALTAQALDRLCGDDDSTAPGALDPPRVGDDADRPLSLAAARRSAVLEELRATGATRVADLGCGEGTLAAALAADSAFRTVLATDVSPRALEATARRLDRAHVQHSDTGRVRLFQTSVQYRDERLRGLDAAVLMEVIEHVDPERLDAVLRNVFGDAAPGSVLVTTPNSEYNTRFETLPRGHFRHPDHRFEWTRAEFEGWAVGVGERWGYRVRLVPVGPQDTDLGAPTQLAVFSKEGA